MKKTYEKELNDSARRRKRVVGAFFSALILSGGVFLSSCGDSSSSSYSASSANEMRVSRIGVVEKVKVLPSDGSVVATAVGEQGVQFTGLNLAGLQEGDVIVGATPITTQAREAINHVGGYIKLANGFYIVHRDQMDENFLAPGNEGYEYFLLHAGRIIQKELETGPLANEGSQAFATRATEARSPNLRGIFGSIGSIFSKAVSSVKNIATSAANSVASGVTNAASAVASGVTSAATSVASGVTSAAHAVANVATQAAQTQAVRAVAVDVAVAAVTSKGTLASVAAAAAQSTAQQATGTFKSSKVENDGTSGYVTTFVTSGLDYSEYIKDLSINVDSIADHSIVLVQDEPRFVGTVKSGQFSASVVDERAVLAAMNGYKVESADGSLAATLSGHLKLKGDEYGSIDIREHTPDEIALELSLEMEAYLKVTDVRGKGVLPIRRIQYTPEVVNADGIPVLVVREVELSLELAGDGKSFDVESVTDAHGVLKVSGPGQVEGYGHAGFQGEEGEGVIGTPSTLKVLSRVSLFDSSGAFIELDLPQDGNKAEMVLGTDLASSGYHEWSTRQEVAVQ